MEQYLLNLPENIVGVQFFEPSTSATY